MKNETYKCGGYEGPIAVPSDVAEYDKLAKKDGAALAAAIDHEVYHGTLGEMRDAAITLIEEVYNVKQRDIGTGVFETETVDGKEVKTEVTNPEKFNVFLARVAAEKNLTGSSPFAKEFARLFAGGDREVKFDPSVHERTGKGVKLAAKWSELATAYLTNGLYNGKKKSLDAIVKALALPSTATPRPGIGKTFTPKPGVPISDPANVTALGWLCKEWSDAQDQTP